MGMELELNISNTVEMYLGNVVLIESSLSGERLLAIVAPEPLLLLGLVPDFGCNLEHFFRVSVAPGHLLRSDLCSIAIEVLIALSSTMSSTSMMAILLSPGFPNGGSELEFFLSQCRITTNGLHGTFFGLSPPWRHALLATILLCMPLVNHVEDCLRGIRGAVLGRKRKIISIMITSIVGAILKY